MTASAQRREPNLYLIDGAAHCGRWREAGVTGDADRAMQLMKLLKFPVRRGSVEEVIWQTEPCIRFHHFRAVPERVCESETFADIVHVCAGDPAPLPARHREPSPRGLNKRNRPGILGPVSKRDMAVLPDPARFRHGDPCRWYVYPT